MRPRPWLTIVVGCVALVACGPGSGTVESTAGRPDATPATTSAAGPPAGWIDPGTSVPVGPEATQVATASDCSAKELQTVLWRGWDSAEGVNSRDFVVILDSARFTQDRLFARFAYHDTRGRFPDAELIADCSNGYWQLAGSVKQISCSDLDPKYMATFAAAYRELGVC